MSLTANTTRIRRGDLARISGKFVRVGSYREDSLQNATVNNEILEVWYNQTSDTIYVVVEHNDVSSFV